MNFCSKCKSRLIEFDVFKKQCIENNYRYAPQQKLNRAKQETDIDSVNEGDVGWLESSDHESKDRKTESSETFIEVCFLEMGIKEVQKFFICDLCGLQILSKKSLKRHFDRMHLNKVGSLKDPKQKNLKKSYDRKSLWCPREGCEKKFYREDRLSAHLRVHEGKKVTLYLLINYTPKLSKNLNYSQKCVQYVS